jgi:hypothetical protein
MRQEGYQRHKHEEANNEHINEVACVLARRVLEYQPVPIHD